MAQLTNTQKISEIIYDAIRDEPFFSRDVIIPKIKALITGFRLDLATANYNQLDNPSKVAQLIRANEMHNLEKEYLKNKLWQEIGDEKMDIVFDELKQKRIEWGA